jgi:thioredoxin 1
VIDLSKDNFDKEVLEEDGLVLVDFWGESCDLCKELMPDVEDLAEEYSEQVKFCKLNIKGNRRLAMGQQVLGLPSIVLYEDGEKEEHLSGEEIEREDIEDAIKKFI